MNEEFITIIPIIVLIALGWSFYWKISTSEEQKDLKNLKEDEFGEYFIEDIKELIGHLEKLPKKNQINVYEQILLWYGKFRKETSKIEPARGSKFRKVYKKFVEEAGRIRRENITEEQYSNTKWLAVTIYETLLFSDSKKISYENGNEIRAYIFLKMKKLIPDNYNLKINLKIENIE
tara:strand:- start:118 stop:648 length:531 start_codon:yes stop_codon:yes gene_type:complete